METERILLLFAVKEYGRTCGAGERLTPEQIESLLRVHRCVDDLISGVRADKELEVV